MSIIVKTNFELKELYLESEYIPNKHWQQATILQCNKPHSNRIVFAHSYIYCLLIMPTLYSVEL